MKRVHTHILIFLLLIAPFIQSDISDMDLIYREVLFEIPPVVSNLSSFLRWIFFGIIIVLVFTNLKKFKNFYNSINFHISCFYFFPFLYAVFSSTDIIRYLGLFIVMSILPIYVSKEFARDNGEYLLKAMKSVIGFTFLISIFASYKAILVGYRFQGVLCNANTYGITATFWITILLIRSKNIGLSNKDVLLAFLIFITIILSGSRSSVIASLLILLYTFSNNLKLITGFAFCIFLLVLSIDYFTSLDFIFSRFENLSNSAVESGRAEIWKNAFSYISLNYNGYGMDAPFLLLGTGNVHNCYIRFLLTMGFFFSIVTIFFYLRLLLILFFKKVEVLPRSLKAFMLAFALSNYAEDFFVGLGSSMLIYLAIIIGFISYFFIPIPNDNPKVNEYSFA